MCFQFEIISLHRFIVDKWTRICLRRSPEKRDVKETLATAGARRKNNIVVSLTRLLIFCREITKTVSKVYSKEKRRSVNELKKNLLLYFPPPPPPFRTTFRNHARFIWLGVKTSRTRYCQYCITKNKYVSCFIL